MMFSFFKKVAKFFKGIFTKPKVEQKVKYDIKFTLNYHSIFKELAMLIIKNSPFAKEINIALNIARLLN